MSSPAKSSVNSSIKDGQDPNPPTIAPFSPSRVAANRQRSTILVQQKSPLLIATPPQITRALAFSHPFLLPLNKLVGLLSWSSGDPWESFLLVGSFWVIVLYGDVLTRWLGPVVVVVGLILGMYSRRYSPLSSTGWTGEKTRRHKKQDSESRMKHQKSLEEIVDTLNTFTSRCNLLLDPLLQLTDFLSTQRTATSATTRPALTSLFLRILMITPIWIGLSLPPLGILTSQRVVLATGTVILSWHSRPARISRTLLWRSMTIRHLLSVITGMDFYTVVRPPDRNQAKPPLPPRKSQKDIASSIASTGKNASPGVRFTFVVYENQRRWLGLGWTSSMFAYERAAWTDEHLNASASKDEFQLPTIDGDHAKWQWVEGQDWQIDITGKSNPKNVQKGGSEGWIYYDSKVKRSDPMLRQQTLITYGTSGTTDDEIKMAGAATPVDENGFETLNSSTRHPSPPKPKAVWSPRRRAQGQRPIPAPPARRLEALIVTPAARRLDGAFCRAEAAKRVAAAATIRVSCRPTAMMIWTYRRSRVIRSGRATGRLGTIST